MNRVRVENNILITPQGNVDFIMYRSAYTYEEYKQYQDKIVADYETTKITYLERMKIPFAERTPEPPLAYMSPEETAECERLTRPSPNKQVVTKSDSQITLSIDVLDRGNTNFDERIVKCKIAMNKTPEELLSFALTHAHEYVCYPYLIIRPPNIVAIGITHKCLNSKRRFNGGKQKRNYWESSYYRLRTVVTLALREFMIFMTPNHYDGFDWKNAKIEFHFR